MAHKPGCKGIILLDVVIALAAFAVVMASTYTVLNRLQVTLRTTTEKRTALLNAVNQLEYELAGIITTGPYTISRETISTRNTLLRITLANGKRLEVLTTHETP